ncbi:hypothetical protein HanXRQr2_Chr16g0764481 [Helianthus annuus]|uniref:Uncharacterized protein n=1 Tax=Helianthus annuus TaxID=4232 RepID=A0A9K3GZ75_HELAN|nr:hypothetical protein HanXRQr2_Chr16g0764481 [Helianthus annuus]
MTDSEQIQSVIPQTAEEATPPEFQETIGGSSSGATTTTVESIGLQLDSGYILKTPLKATTVEDTIVSFAAVGSPQYQDKVAFVYDDLETSPIIKTNKTTTCRDSGDLIKLGDELRYKKFTDKMTEMKEMMKQMLEHSQSQPNTQQIANELWNSVQSILQAQRNLAEINHNTHMELIRNMVDARYKVTQADIEAIREQLVKFTSSALQQSFMMMKTEEDDAKKGDKDSLRKTGHQMLSEKRLKESPKCSMILQ